MSTVVAIRAFRDNYIWALTAATPGSALSSPRPCVIVDPGDAQPVIDGMAEGNLSPVAVLITHHHSDHVGGIRRLVEKWPMPVFGPARESIAGISMPLKEGDCVELPAEIGRLSVLDVPGHTSGHIAYFGANALFCGDTLFGAGCGRLFEGTPAQMFDSLNKLARLPTSTRVYCAHEYTLSNLKFAAAVEPDNDQIATRRQAAERALARNQPTLPSTLGEELATNPFLRCGEAAVQRSAEAHAGRALNGPLEVFTVIRQWKDQW